jgi:hypothetical protein
VCTPVCRTSILQMHYLLFYISHWPICSFTADVHAVPGQLNSFFLRDIKFWSPLFIPENARWIPQKRLQWLPFAPAAHLCCTCHTAFTTWTVDGIVNNQHTFHKGENSVSTHHKIHFDCRNTLRTEADIYKLFDYVYAYFKVTLFCQ